MDPIAWATVSNSIAPEPAPLKYPISIPTANPNPVHAQPTPEPFTYYSEIEQQQKQPQYCHFQQPQAHIVPDGAVHSEQNWHYYQAYALGGLAHQPGAVVPSIWAEQPVAAFPNATPTLPSQAVQSYGLGIGTQTRVSKKRKLTKSAYCDICQVECNSKDILEQHKTGKKHLKNMSKTILPQPSATVARNSVIGAAQKSKGTALSQQDLESKRLKVVAGGAAVAAVRVCAACNVVCNSETVFNYHIAGQKHAASMKKYLASTTGKNNVT